VLFTRDNYGNRRNEQGHGNNIDCYPIYCLKGGIKVKEIFTRRSMRKYEDRPVEDEQIQQLLRAAMYAPSAGNEQTWHFVVVKDRTKLDNISRFHPFAKMLKQAPLAIVPCCDTGLARYKGSFWIQGISAAIQNMLLMATHLGLGSCWCGVYPREKLVEKVSAILNLPPDIIPAAIVVIGYPAEKVEAPERFLPERIHYERW